MERLSVTRQHFKAILSQFESGYTFLSKAKEDKEARLNLYHGALQGFTDEVIVLGFQVMSRDWQSKEFPTPGIMLNFILATDREKHLSQTWPHSVWKVSRHECVLGKHTVTLAWKILEGLSPYEARHIFCNGKPQPVCPICGRIQEPIINPTIAKLASLFPEICKDWNPYHKGYQICANCESIKNPREAREMQERVRLAG